MPKQLLTETFFFRPLTGKSQLIERKTSDFVRLNPAGVKLVENVGRTYTARSVTGVFQNYINENANKRIYPESLWRRVFAEGSTFSERLKSRSVLGVLEHPEDGQTKISDVSHVVTEARFATAQEISESGGELVEGDIIGTYETVPTAAGKDLEALLEANLGFGVSSRGAGNVIERSGTSIVEDDFDLDTWDVVTNPSVGRARPKVTVTVESAPAVAPIVESTDSGTVPVVPSVPPHKVQECDDTPTPFVKSEKDLAETADGELAGALINEAQEVIGGVRITEHKSSICPTFFISEASIGGGVVTGNVTESLGKALEEANKVIGAVLAEQKATVSNTISEMNLSLYFPRKSKSKPAPEPQTQTESTKNRPMSKFQELMRKKSEVVRLTATRVEGMKSSDKAALLHEASQLRMEIDTISESDTSLRTEALNLQTRLNKFESYVDEEAAPPAPPAAPGPEAPPAPGPDAPVEEGPIDAALPPDVIDALGDAAATIQELTDGTDEEAAALVAELEGLAASGPEEELPADPETDFVDDIPANLGESRNNARRFVKKQMALEAIHRALIFASKRLLERNKSNRANLGESKVVARLTEERDNYKEAAEQLAAKYNTDMIKAGTRNLQISKPKFFEAVKAKLAECKTWKRFVAVVNENAPAGTPKLAESTNPPAPAPSTLTEGKDKPAPAAPAPDTSDLAESHSAVQFVKRNRIHG